MAHVVVTGGSGLVGANLVGDLVRAGRRVRVLVRADTRALDGLPVDLVACDIRDAPGVSEAVAGADVVYHLASSISVGQLPAAYVHAVNVGGTQNVVRACRERGVGRLVYCSSIHALDHRPDEVPVDERRPLWADGRHCSAYDFSKASAERVVLEAVRDGLDAVIVNPTAILGPRDFKPSWMGRFLVRLSRGHLPVLMDAGFDWVDARDVAAGALAAAARGRRGERYLLTGHWCSLPDLAAVVTRVTGRPLPCVALPVAWAQALAGPYSCANRLVGRVTPITPEAVEATRHCRVVSRAKAVRELGYCPRPLPETVRDTLAWLDGRARPTSA